MAAGPRPARSDTTWVASAGSPRSSETARERDLPLTPPAALPSWIPSRIPVRYEASSAANGPDVVATASSMIRAGPDEVEEGPTCGDGLGRTWDAPGDAEPPVHAAPSRATPTRRPTEAWNLGTNEPGRMAPKLRLPGSACSAGDTPAPERKKAVGRRRRSAAIVTAQP